jgi:hypothetical protein
MLRRDKKSKREAIEHLCAMVHPPPVRPLYYVQEEMRKLRSMPRNCIRYLGDYIDLLTKAMALEFVGDKAATHSLGSNARALESVKELKDLPAYLIRYGDFVYTRAKHDFSLPPGSRHTFTTSDVVWTTYVTVELADWIKSASKLAKAAVEKDTLHFISGKWADAEDFRKRTSA